MKLEDMTDDDKSEAVREAEAIALENARGVYSLSNPDRAQALYDRWVAEAARRAKKSGLSRADVFVAIAGLVAHYLTTSDQECPHCRRSEAVWIVSFAHSLIENGGTPPERSIN